MTPNHSVSTASIKDVSLVGALFSKSHQIPSRRDSWREIISDDDKVEVITMVAMVPMHLI